MGAVWIRARGDLRERWRASLALAVLIGLSAGAVLAGAAGARRTESVYPRFAKAQRAMDFVLTPDGSGGLEALPLVARFPEVAESGRLFLVPAAVVGPSGKKLAFPDVYPLLDPEGRYGTTINRMKVLSGRAPDPDRPDEATASFSLAESLRLKLGSQVRVEISTPGAAGNAPPGSDQVTSRSVRVVGIEVSPGELSVLTGGNAQALHLTPAFYRENRTLIPPDAEGLVVRVGTGASPARFLQRIVDGRLPVGIGFDQAAQGLAQRRSNHFLAIALWLLAALAAMTAVAVFGQALGRQTFLESAENPILRAVGMSSWQLTMVSVLRGALVGGLAACIAAAAAILLSPLTPIGQARLIEPTPGLFMDGLVIGAGFGATVLAVIALTLVPAWRAARLHEGVQGTAELSSVKRVSRVGNALAGSGFPPPAVTGVRMALEPGHGRTAVPVRTTILGTTFGVVALVAAVTFSLSLGRLQSSPRLFGWNWDAALFSDTTAMATEESTAMLRLDPRIGSIARGSGADVKPVGLGVPIFGLSFDPVKGDVGPAILEGRAPASADETALGTETLRVLGARIGGTVALEGVFQAGQEHVQSARFRVVGRLVFPAFTFIQSGPGQGATFTIDGLRRMTNGAQLNVFFVRFRPGVDRARALADLQQAGLFPIPRRETGDQANLKRVTKVPVVLAGLLTAMAAATLAHTLITSIRRRRRDLAILKTLGFVRRQVRTTVAWQASALAIISVALGLPLGVAAGRWGWRLFTDQLGVVPSPVLPSLTLALAIPVALVLANLIALVPGRIAAGMRPALILRSE